MTILIVGVGNTLRGDDGAGPETARRLAEALAVTLEEHAGEDAVRLLLLHQLTPEVALELAQPDVEAAIFTDAAADSAPGEVRVLRLHAAGGDAPSSHHVAPALLLAMAQALYGRCPPAWLVTVGGAAYGHGEGFSPEVAAALERMPAVARELLPDIAPYLGRE
jgi:hydrogenase maturation protease